MKKINLKITGMHCTSCAMNIDGALEDLAGVISANTNYAKAMTTVEFDEMEIDVEKLKKTIEAEGYSV